MSEEKELRIEKIKSFVKGILDDSFEPFFPARKHMIDMGLFDARGGGEMCEMCGRQGRELVKPCVTPDEKEITDKVAAREEKLKKIIDNANWDNILN